MTTSVDLDFVLIREKSIPDIARHIIQLLQNHRAIDVCYTLLDSVRSELLGPAVFDILLSATKSIDCITACLRQNHSIRIRKQAIKQYGKALADIDRWKEAWESMGSTRGILEYLSTISVDEAQTLCSRIGRCNIRTTKLAERAAVVQDLLQAIDPVSYPGGVHVTPEKRPLERFAALLIPSCSSEFLQNLMDNGVYKTLYRSLSISLALKSHESSILRYTVDMTLNNESKTTQNDVRQYLTRFVYNNPSTPSDEKYFSASMKFSETMLEERLKKPKMVWPYTPSESNIYFCLLRRCLKRRLTKQRLYSVMELGMRLLEFNPNLENQFVKHCALYWQRITIYWGLWPEYWEDLVIRGMQLGLEGSGQNISASFLRFVDNSKIKEDRTWDAFRLLCLHLPKGKIEIGTTKDLRLLDRQKWNLEVLEKLPADKAIRILQFLLSDKLNSDFLDQVPSYSILHLSRVGDQYNFNALLYQTMLQISMPDELQRSKGYQRAIEAYENLKGQSESSREQQDRALYAKAAGLFAIASGSLEFYGAHVKWLVRFVQDPLTVKVIFGRYAIASKEASNLLSGIPYPLPKTTTLSKISKNVSMANAILLQFHEHQKAAKRQPSYQDCDWNAWRTLLVSSITTRIDRAPILQNNINASQGELYSQLWSQTLALFSQIGFEYMNKIEPAISNLLVKLPPKTLTVVTQNMLATDDKYRASQAKGKNAEDESRMIEKLTYKCLISLAEGDNPSLAGDLIVHTIIERPDASSWHRQLLGLGFFKRLPARNAETLLLHFSKAIGEKLEEQAYDRIGEAVGTPSIVKVTTVKYLAQILQNAEFLSLEASIDVLLELFKVATHPDIRIATLDSMIASLENLALSEVKESIHDISNIQNPLIRKILLALNTVIPVVGSINERTPPKEQDWIEAAEDLSKLPKPIECQIIRPLWSRLLYSAETSKKFKAYFIQNLLIPAMKVSISEHRRWLALFLKKYNAGFGIDELPSFVPSNRQIIGNLLTRFNQSIPAYVLKGWNEYVAFSLEKPMFLSRFISSLEADEENRVKVDVKHFLAIFDYPVIQIVQDETNRLIDIVHHNWKPSILPDQQGITLQQLQAIILQQLRLIILNYDKNFTLWASLIRYFRHPTGSKADYERWKKDFRPIMRNLINMIEGMRTPQWLSSPDRRPAILPSISLLRLWALNYPQPDSTATQSDSQSFELGQELLEFVEEHFSDFSKALNREKFMTEIMTVSEKLNDRQNVRIALVFLGTDQKSNVVVAIVRAELALRFLAKGRKTLEKDIKARDGVTRLINLWKDSPVEDIRELVLDLQMSSGHDSLWDIIVSSKAN